MHTQRTLKRAVLVVFFSALVATVTAGWMKLDRPHLQQPGQAFRG